MADTQVELVASLEKVKHMNPKKIQRMIEQAKRGHYHDFKSNMMMPKVGLVRELQGLGLDTLAGQVINGEYDEEYPSVEQEKEFSEALKNGIPARA